MSYSLSDGDRTIVRLMSADGRYRYFLEKVVAGGEVWSLRSDDGWVVMTSPDEEEDECLPVWPHHDFAQEWASGEWADCKPAAIALDTWLERWTPGLERDATLLVVFPDSEGEGTIVTPEELRAEILEARGERRG